MTTAIALPTIAIVTTHEPDRAWIARAIADQLTVVDAAERADVVVASPDQIVQIDRLQARCLVVIASPGFAGARSVAERRGESIEPPAPSAAIAYAISRAWPDEPLAALLVALATQQPRPPTATPPPDTAEQAHQAQRAIAAGRALAAVTDLAALEASAVALVRDLLGAERAHCLFYDPADALLWSQAIEARSGDDRRAIAGLAGFAARTGLPASAERAAADPRFDRAIDDPSGADDDRVIAHPVFGSDGAIHAVLIAVRHGRRSAFSALDAMMLERLARLAAPILDQLALETHVQTLLENDPAGRLFRREAIEVHSGARWGDVVRVAPPWLSPAYWLLVALLVGSVVFIALGTVSTYSSGPAIIRSSARTPVTARTEGNVIAVDVVPGDRIAAGAVIARLDDTDQRAAVASLERELQTQLRNHMLDPADASADLALRTVRNQLGAARAALGERLIRTATAGVVSDVRVRFGQRVAPGDIAASIVDNTQRLEVIALLPGADRPQLAPGMVMRVELAGYRYAYRSIVIDRVSPDVISSSEAHRVLGAEVADSLERAGPVVLVRGWLSSSDFELDGRTFRYHDGMLGTAEVRVRSESILYAILPGARRVW